MAALPQFARELNQLHASIRIGHGAGVLLHFARCLPLAGILHSLPAPTDPDDRAEWDSYAGPALVTLRSCQAMLFEMGTIKTPRGVYLDTHWLRDGLEHVADILRLPGLDDLYTGVPAAQPDRGGGGVVGAVPPPPVAPEKR